MAIFQRPATAHEAKQQTSQGVAFYAQVLQKKYESERAKRLHTDGLQQYQSISGNLNHLLNDPYIQQPCRREPLHHVEFDVLIVGGGFGAQFVAIELLKKGISKIILIEKAGDFGGAWYWNRYPGVQCDIESYVYMPLLEETEYMPSRKYAKGQEIFQHARRIGQHFGLYEKALFQTEAESMCWNENLGQWVVRTNQNDILHARFVVPATGPLHRPKLPRLPGLDTFKGHSFHTSRWDYGYTGGAHDDDKLENLKNKRVGVIGTGATAIQIVPHLGQWAQELYVFQRTPSAVDVRGNSDTSANWAASLTPGWQQERMTNFNGIINGEDLETDLVNDGWSQTIRNLSTRNLVSISEDKVSPQSLRDRRQLLDFQKMEQIRERVSKTINDQKTAASLKPYYNFFCKRPCFHDEYLPTFNRQNVTLVDTQGRGVSAITEKGVIANGKTYELDCIIFATGFEIATPWTQRAGIEVTGLDGLSLSDKWKQGTSTLHGHSTRGFPNCFFMQVSQAAISPNFLHVTRFQAEHLGYIIGQCLAKNVRAVQPTQQAEDDWVRQIVAGRQKTKDFRAQCTPGYYNNEGTDNEETDRRANWAGGPIEWMGLMEEWRKGDEMKGLELTTDEQPPRT